MEENKQKDSLLDSLDQLGDLNFFDEETVRDTVPNLKSVEPTKEIGGAENQIYHFISDNDLENELMEFGGLGENNERREDKGKRKDEKDGEIKIVQVPSDEVLNITITEDLRVVETKEEDIINKYNLENGDVEDIREKGEDPEEVFAEKNKEAISSSGENVREKSEAESKESRTETKETLHEIEQKILEEERVMDVYEKKLRLSEESVAKSFSSSGSEFNTLKHKRFVTPLDEDSDEEVSPNFSRRSLTSSALGMASKDNKRVFLRKSKKAADSEKRISLEIWNEEDSSPTKPSSISLKEVEAIGKLKEELKNPNLFTKVVPKLRELHEQVFPVEELTHRAREKSDSASQLSRESVKDTEPIFPTQSEFPLFSNQQNYSLEPAVAYAVVRIVLDELDREMCTPYYKHYFAETPHSLYRGMDTSGKVSLSKTFSL